MSLSTLFRIRFYRTFDEQEDWKINTEKTSFYKHFKYNSAILFILNILIKILTPTNCGLVLVHIMKHTQTAVSKLIFSMYNPDSEVVS